VLVDNNDHDEWDYGEARMARLRLVWSLTAADNGRLRSTNSTHS